MVNCDREIAQRRAGIGFRHPHYGEIVATRPAVGFLEVHAENYMTAGPAVRQLDTLRSHWPISLHGVGMSLGSARGLDRAHLDRFAALVTRVEPTLISEHLAWSVSGDGVYLNDLLPLPYTEESLAIVTANVGRMQNRLGRQVLIENPSSYLRFVHSTIPEALFLSELVRRTGCGLLFDVNNVYVTCQNLGGDPWRWIDDLPVGAVKEIHLAGHCVNDADGSRILIDDHGAPVAPAVWDLYEGAVRRFPFAATMIEWDSNLPALPVLLAEAAEADHRRQMAFSELRHARVA
ncbi:MAG: DUF692 domain-containing protein [Rhodospirillales bacterium]